ncbi:MAG: IS21 family transposase [Candidatus Acidiferrales bacterium]
MLKRHAIQVLRNAGHTLEEIGTLVAVGKRTVQRVVAEPMITDQSTGTPERESPRSIGRPAKAEAYRGLVTTLLTAEPELLSVELLRRAKLAGYDGAKSALYELVRAVRVVTPRPVIRFEGLPGEFTQHDFGEVIITFLNGTTQRVHFFASRLKYSRWVEVTLVPNQQVEMLARTLVDHFAALGGIPLLAVFDRPKTVALSWKKNGEVIEWNPIFAGVVLDLGLGIEVCWPHAPQQKGAIENLVGWVKGSFFKQRRFLDTDDLQRQLAEWLVEVNTARPSRATGIIPAVRRAEEQPRLRPLKIAPAALALRIPIVVGATAYVTHDTHRYSMHSDAIGLSGTLYLHRDTVRIVAGRFETTHARLTDSDAIATLPEHRTQHVAAVSGKRGKRYLERQHLLELGPVVHAYLTELTHRRPRIWVQDVERMHALLQVHGVAATRAAFAQGLDARVFGAEYIAHYLTAGSHPVPLPIPELFS